MKILGAQPIARYAEPKERSARVAIFDSFAGKGEMPEHGDSVEKIILGTTGLKDKDVQNFQNSYDRQLDEEDVFSAKPESLLEVLEAYTEETVTGFLGATQANIETILADPKGKIRVINQSQSQCAARVARPFLDHLEKNENFRLAAKEALGLPLRARTDTVAQTLLEQVQKTFDESEKIERAEESYSKVSKKAFDRGIVHVVTAGNLGRLAAKWENDGIKAPANAYRSVLANEYATVLGATDSRGTTTVRDDRAASFTSIHAGAEFAMHGVNVEVVSTDPKRDEYSNGTSFSAPQATGLISDMIKINPKLGVTEIEGLLRSASVPVQGSPEQVGAGQIDFDRALYLATQTAFIAKG